MKLAVSLALAFAAAAPIVAHADPAVIFDMGGKFDKSFNQSAYEGAERWKKETGKNYLEFEISNDTQRMQAIRRMAERGASPIISIGFAQASALEQVAKDFPKTQFAIIDATVNKPNVQSVTFKEHEGSYLVGAIAVTASKTGKVGFVGGMDIPLIHAFFCGYKEGFMATNKDGQVFENYTGTTATAWNDPTTAGELAKADFDKGADIVYAAAGASGLGVIQAAKDAGKLSIGVDSNQNYIHPGQILTSMQKRVDTATYNAFTDFTKDPKSFAFGHISLGLKEGGVAAAMDDNNAKLITPEMKAAVDKATADINSGALTVFDARSDGKCDI